MLKGDGKKVADLKGMDVNLVELSVSHYLLARALDSVGLTEKDLKVVNTSDADMAAEQPHLRLQEHVLDQAVALVDVQALAIDGGDAGGPGVSPNDLPASLASERLT